MMIVRIDADLFSEFSWSFKRKWAATAIVSAFTFISPVSSSMVAPASDQLAAQFGITNSAIIALTISVFVLAYGKLKSTLSLCPGDSDCIYVFSIWTIVLGSAQ